MLIAREVALDVSESTYASDVGGHLPWDANVTADTPSRRWDPDAGEWRLPLALAGATEAVAPQRNRAYYRTLAPPRQRLDRLFKLSAIRLGLTSRSRYKLAGL